MSHLKIIVVALVILVSGCASTPFEFAVIGDNPYKAVNLPKYELMIERINANSDLKWVVHLGDMKDGGVRCDDEFIESLYELNQRFDKPFVLTPGDNDWFDCKRSYAGGFDRLERLEKLRNTFYPQPGMADTLEVVTQADSDEHPDYVENVYWVDRQVMFATLHVIGTTGREGGMDINSAVVEAADAWMNTVFDEAEKQNSKGVFIAMQADLFPFSGERGWLGSLCERCIQDIPFYTPLYKSLRERARTYKNPIVIAMGDTHIFRVDKPLYDQGKLVTHFTRLEVFGESEVHWVRVVVDPDSSEVFSFHQEIIPENIDAGVGNPGNIDQ